MRKTIKLTDLTPERLAELAGVAPPEQEKAPRTVAEIRRDTADVRSRPPTREFALAQLRHAYMQMIRAKSIDQPASFARGLLSPAILYLESLEDS